MIALDHFYNLHYGKTGLIICNGPSLRDVPNKFLKKYPNFGLNNIWLRENFTPDYYIACDPLAIRASIAEILDIHTTKFIESAKRRIINLTPNTALDVFEKDSIENW